MCRDICKLNSLPALVAIPANWNCTIDQILLCLLITLLQAIPGKGNSRLITNGAETCLLATTYKSKTIFQNLPFLDHSIMKINKLNFEINPMICLILNQFLFFET